MEFKFLQIKGQVPFKGEIITKMWWGHLKILFLRTMKPEKAELMKAFWHRTKAS
jgi:hypothetical protein